MFVTHADSLLERGDFSGWLAAPQAPALREAARLKGDDIQGFIRTHYDPTHASRKDFYAADMNGDGVVDAQDLDCFRETLVNETRCADATTLCSSGESGFGSGGMNAPSQGSGESSGGGGPAGAPPTNTELQARYALLTAWEAANPRPDSPLLSAASLAWVASRCAYMVDVGLMTQALADGTTAFYVWESVNQRSDHPELTAAQYETLVLSQFEADVVTNIGGSP